MTITQQSWTKLSIRRSSIAVSAVLAAFGVPVHAETRGGVNVDLSGGVSTNPFDRPGGGSQASALASLGISPWLVIKEEATTVTFNGNARIDQYLSQYGRNDSELASVTVLHRISQETSISGGVQFSSSRSNNRNQLLYRQNNADFVPIAPEPLPDVGVEGILRSKVLRGFLHGDRKISARDTISFDASAQASRYSGLSGSNFNTFTVGTSYSRRLNERTTVLASVTASKADYLGRRIGDSVIVSPQFGLNRQLAAGWKLTATAGVSIVSRNALNNTTVSSTGFAGSLGLCKQSERSVFCLNAGRAAQPTSSGQIGTVNSIAAAYDRTISQHERLGVSLTYGDSDANLTLVPGSSRRTRFAGAAATYSRTINDRLSAFVSPSISRRFDGLAGRKANFQIEAGIRARFGSIR